MENGYFRPGDPLPKSAKRENAITELLNRVGMTGIAPSKGGSLPAGCVHCAWLPEVEAGQDVPANWPVYIVSSVPDSDIVIVSDIPETGRPFDGIIIESFKTGSVGTLRLNGWIEVAINNPEQFDGFSRYVWWDYYTNTFNWMCSTATGIPIGWVLESKFLSPQKALVRVESIGNVSSKSILVAEHQLFYVDQLTGAVFVSADRLPTENNLELLFFRDGSWIGVFENGFQNLLNYSFLKTQSFSGLAANDILLIEQQNSSIEIIDFPKETLPFIHAGQDDPNALITIRICVYYCRVYNVIQIDEAQLELSTRYIDPYMISENFEFTLLDFQSKIIPFRTALFGDRNHVSFTPSSDATGCVIGFFDENSPTGFTYTSGASVLINS